MNCTSRASDYTFSIRIGSKYKQSYGSVFRENQAARALESTQVGWRAPEPKVAENVAPLNNPAHNAANYQRLRDFYASQHTGPLGPADGLADLARLRGQLGNVPGGGQVNGGVLARLDAGGRSFYGVNAHGQPTTLRVNAISASHAEMDAFQQAANANVRGGTGRLFVDRNLCDSCDLYGGVRSMARQLGLERLEVITPSGTPVVIIP